ncbi:glycosyltransferase [Synechococcus sp. CBW1107]|uniref:glycosyltransferase n=1 Tax=Synechococcus sp. CBW1107 TaxID=2789857 RepID=UPI002AD4C520|nr:glycosyltransferase [Synechococcus sp. CBW1107]CAK6700303.1 GDP-mannose-dependent alpha-mannosyltransferase [Synechococcus sp. CBW1107]
MTALPTSIALVHEWFTPRAVGGSEAVVEQLDALLHPQLFALVDGESQRPGSWLHGRRIETSFIQTLPWGVSHVQQYLPLLPLAIEQLDMGGYPLVLSSNHLVAKGVITGPDQLHVSYVHTPVRYAWDQMHAYLARSALARSPLGPLIRGQLHRLRQWDVVSSSRVDHLIANSRFTARRIQRCWRRTATVVHPPVEVARFRWDQPRSDTYLSVCRLVPYKRVDLVVGAFNRLGLPLVVIGDGPERRRLEAMAGPNVQFLGHRPADEVTTWLQQCRAYVYAGLEDFGIAPVEAMAAGAPVIALGQGGLLDSVRCLESGAAQPTGLLFPDQSVESLAAALDHFHTERLWRRFPADAQHEWALRFSPACFRRRIQERLETLWLAHRHRLAHARAPVPLEELPPIDGAA